MGLPTIEKTWSSYRVGSIYNTSIVTTNRLFLIEFKNLFKAMGWTVSGSGNGTTGAMDGSDRWGATTDIVFGTSSRSWIVLKNTSLGSGSFQVLFDLQASTTYQYDFYVSPGGNYTGGGTSKPTATDELLISSDTAWGLANTADCTRGLQCYKSSDNKHTRLIVTYNNTAYGIMMFETPGSERTYWTSPWYVFFDSGDASDYIAGTSQAVTVINSVKTYITFTCPHYASVPFYSSAYYTNGPGPGGIVFSPSLLVGKNGTNRGVLGKAVDLWTIPNGEGIGRYFHSSGTKILTNFRNLVMPCAGEIFRVE